MKLFRKPLALLALSLIAAAPQETPQITSLGETIDVSIVNVDVFVADKRGNAVRGLTKDDFEILEDGKAQPITNFAEFRPDVDVQDANGAVSVTGSTGGAESTVSRPQPRTIVFFADTFTLPDFESEPLFDSLRKTIRELVRPGDAITIVSWHGNMLLTRLPFTDDHARIDAVLTKLQRETAGADPRDAYEMSQQQRREIEEEFLAEATELSGSTSGINDPFEFDIAAIRARTEVRKKYAAIRSLISGISGMEGKKVMLLATRRLSRIAGGEFTVPVRGALPQPRTSDKRFDMEKEIQSVIDLANANGVTIYPFHPEGVKRNQGPDAMQGMMAARDFYNPRFGSAATSSRDAQVLGNEMDSLTVLAKETGGIAQWGAINIGKTLPRVQQDLDSYYSLAYRAQPTGRDRARDISVRAKNRAYTVRSRRQFIERSEASKMRDRVIANLFRAPDDTSIPISAIIGPIRRLGPRRYSQKLTVRIPVASLLAIPGDKGNSGAFTVYVGWGGVLGDISGVSQGSHPFTIPSSALATTKGQHFEYGVDVEIDERTDRLSIGVYDDVAKTYGFTLIELPPRSQMRIN